MTIKTFTVTLSDEDGQADLLPYIYGPDLCDFVHDWQEFLRSKTKHASEDQLKTDWEQVRDEFYNFLKQEGLTELIGKLR